MSGFVQRNQNGLRQLRTTVKILLYTLVGTGATIAGGFAGVHALVERHDTTPSGWSRGARFSYRAGVFNRDYLGQDEAARAHFEVALAEITEGSNDDAPRFVGMNADPAAIAALTRLYIMLGDLHRRSGRLQSASRLYGTAVERAVSDRQLLGAAARRLGQLQEVEGDASEAERSLSLAVSCFLQTAPPAQHEGSNAHAVDTTHSQGLFGSFFRRASPRPTGVLHEAGGGPVLVPADVRYDGEMVEAVVAYALFRARRGHLQESLQTLLSLLRVQQTHPAAQDGSNKAATWSFTPALAARSGGGLPRSAPATCLTASTMSTIGEVVWALGSRAEAERWARESLELCTRPPVKDEDYCGRCAALNLNTLGLLAKERGDVDAARRWLERAIIAAERLGDEGGVNEFTTNMQSL